MPPRAIRTQANAWGISMTRTTIVIAAALALAVTLPAAPAQAQATRAFVSAAGSDNNSCINTNSPCRHFQNAYNAMPNGGEIDVLDPGNYGALTVNHGLDIVGRGWATVGAASGLPSITINAGSNDKIYISGVLLDGANVTGTTGIQFNSGVNLTVRDSVIRNFTGSGIFFGPNSSTSSEIFVSNTLVSDNGGDGISISPTGSGTTTGVLDHDHVENNGGNGIIAMTSTQTINVTVGDSVSADNTSDGIIASGTTPVAIMVRSSTMANNGMDGLVASGAGATIRVTRSTITGNASGTNELGGL